MVSFRPITPADHSAILALNAACQPAVGDMDATKLAFFAASAPYFPALVDAQDHLVGFLIGLTEDNATYASKNYQWFRARHPRFAYVDRIALAKSVRGQGLGPRFYEAFADWAREQKRPLLCAEVNTRPDNPHSHHFHRAFGFEEVARTQPYGPDKEVAMYEMAL